MFDPYHKWLGIAPKDQPPNHYRLLAVDLFESDLEVIDAGANRQMAYLQQRATGEHGSLSQKLLNEIAAARLCLLNPRQKAEYDAAQRETLALAISPDEEDDALQTGVDLNSILDASLRPSLLASRRAPYPVVRFLTFKHWQFVVAIGGTVMLILACWAIFLLSGQDTAQVKRAEHASVKPPKKTSLAARHALPPANAVYKHRSVAASSPSPPQNPELSADLPNRGASDDTEDATSAIYTVDIDPPMAELSVGKFYGVEVTGTGSHRKIVFGFPDGRSSVLVVAECDGYQEKSTSVTPKPGGREHLAITLEKERRSGEQSEESGPVGSGVQSKARKSPWDEIRTSSPHP